MVEVFKTNVSERTEADKITNEIEKKFTDHKVNFDLEDCDRILRVQSSVDIDCRGCIRLLRKYGYYAEVLDDNILAPGALEKAPVEANRALCSS